MSVNVGPSDDERYGWPGAEEGDLASASHRIARLLSRSGTPTVGFLPVDDSLGRPERLAPLLVRVGEAILGFTDKAVAVVDAWPTWPWGEASVVGADAAHRLRWLRPRVMEIAPTPCGDAPAAMIALQNALAARPDTVAMVLVNLAGYAAAGVVPAAAGFVDGLVLVVSARRSRKRAVSVLAQQLPPARRLGAVLLGQRGGQRGGQHGG